MDLEKFKLALVLNGLELVTGQVTFYDNDDIVDISSIPKLKHRIGFFCRIQDAGFDETYQTSTKTVVNGQFIYYADADNVEEAVSEVVAQWNKAHYGID
jgi:hypothetical protein